MAAVHDCVGCQRGLVTTICALEAAIPTDSIAMLVTAYRANKPIGPLNFVEIIEASFLVRETPDKLAETQGFFLDITGTTFTMPVYIGISPLFRIYPYISCFAYQSR